MNQMADLGLPKVLVVGDPRLGELLAQSGAMWDIQPVATSVSGMWDAIEAGSIPSDCPIAIFSDGTATTPDELEATLAAFAPFSDTFLFADPARGQMLIDRAKALAPTVPNGDPSKAIWLLPVHDATEAFAMMKQILVGKVQWASDSSFAPSIAAQIDDSASVSMAAYEQAGVYSTGVREQGGIQLAKPSNARPGQMTIASMSSKGGSGKSTTAMLLAGTIAKCSAAAGDPKRVVIVDLDTRDGQVGSLIGQYMPTSINIRVMPKWDAETIQANLVHDKRLGIDALLAPVRPRNADDVGPDFYRHVIQVLQTTHDVVILDCSVNYLDPLLGVGFALADEILFVTTLATTSVQGMARSLTELFADPADGGLGIPREKIGVVANQVINNVGMGKDKLLRAALGAPLVGQIPSDQDAVLIATNSNRMGDLLKHPKIGPAFYKLAVNCLPNIHLAPLTVEQAQVQEAIAAPKGQAESKKGIFRR